MDDDKVPAQRQRAEHRRQMAIRFNPIDTSGEFTAEKISRLKRFGNWLTALATCELTPITQDQRHIVACVTGQCEPTTERERLWLRYSNQQ